MSPRANRTNRTASMHPSNPMLPKCRSARRARTRRGSIYLIALGTSLIVVCLGLASLNAARTNRRLNNGTTDHAAARALARSGIESAQKQIQINTAWRTQLANKTISLQTPSIGTINLTYTDPVDANLSNNSLQPVIVKSEGRYNNSVSKLTALLEPQQQLYPACRAAIVAKNDIGFWWCSLSSNHWAVAGDEIIATAFFVNINCYAANNITGFGMNQRRVRGGPWPQDAPNMDPLSATYMGKFYSDIGTVLSAADLPTAGTELLKNPSFDVDITNWSTVGSCKLTRDTSKKSSGAASCSVTLRTTVDSTPAATVTEHIQETGDYSLSFAVRPTIDQYFNGVLYIESTGESPQSFNFSSLKLCKANEWTTCTGTVEPSWKGALTKAEIRIRSDKKNDYNIDACQLTNTNWDSSKRYIDGRILSDTENPYGSRTPNPLGVYVINANNDQLVITNARIRGTLIVNNASSVLITNSVLWDPVGKNYPAIISTSSITDSTSSSSLDESKVGVDFNTVTTPYQGTSNTNATDQYSAGIVGPVVSLNDISLDGQVAYTGPIMAGDSIDVTSSNLQINFPSDIIHNPPPGFCPTTPTMRYISSSLQQVP